MSIQLYIDLESLPLPGDRKSFDLVTEANADTVQIQQSKEITLAVSSDGKWLQVKVKNY